MKGKALWRLVTNVLQERILSSYNSPFLASSHVPCRQRQTRASRDGYNEQEQRSSYSAQFFFINDYVIHLITK